MKTGKDSGILHRESLIGISSATMSALLFGISPVVARLAYAGGSNGMTMTFARSLFSIPILFIFAKMGKISLRLCKKEFIALAMISMFGNFATTLMLYSSYQYINVGMATVLHYFFPVIVMLISVFLFKEKVKCWKILSLMLALFGVLTFLIGSNGANLLGMLLALGSAISYAVLFISIEHTVIKTLHSITLTFYTNVFVCIFAFILGQASGLLNLNMTLSAWTYSLILSLMVGVGAFILLNRAIVLVGASTASVIYMLEPLTGVMFGYLILKESLSLINWIGCILIIVGAAIITTFTFKESLTNGGE